MALPPASVPPTSITLTRAGAVTITATFVVPAGATVGADTVNATFGPYTI